MTEYEGLRVDHPRPAPKVAPSLQVPVEPSMRALLCWLRALELEAWLDADLAGAGASVSTARTEAIKHGPGWLDRGARERQAKHLEVDAI